MVGIVWRVRLVVGAVNVLHRDPLAQPSVVRADVELRACGEDNVLVSQYELSVVM